YVADHGREIEGYVTCKLLGAGVGQIGLFAVSAPARGRGIGRHLLNAAIQWFAERDCRAVDVVTQGSNVAAQRIYQRHGFVTRDVSVWLHKWFAKT
ncbi:MAG: GNAT family N-acetyltransferase, partial [Kiritimatiellae bacterium]|nr:GNAT family N-acetyltransferase [Kiritimatiellia bacterium]MDW8459538.1 GNAT family N-acetyltransferase [Verrucomicrobiota bacterium]